MLLSGYYRRDVLGRILEADLDRMYVQDFSAHGHFAVLPGRSVIKPWLFGRLDDFAH